MRPASAELAAPRQQEAAARPASGPGTRWWVLAVVLLLSGLAVWLTSLRFELDTPSLVDDWAAITKADDQLGEVLRFRNPEEQRFRPGWIAWNYLQWYTLDAPHGMVGPNVWNVLRILVLVGGLTLLTALALPPPRRRSEAALHAALAGIPAFVVVTAPKLTVDLARFGPQEPLLVGGIMLGGALLVLTARVLLDPQHAAFHPRTAALLVVGGGLWSLGVYHKETSLAALPLLAAALFAGRARLASWRRLSTRRRAGLVALGAVVTLPLLHVAYESLRIVLRGDLVYDAEVDAGRGAWAGVDVLWHWADEALPWAGRAFVVSAVVLTALAFALRRRLDVVALGALASGALAFAIAGQSGVLATRYYMPSYALFAVAFVLSLVRFPPLVQLAGLLLVVFAFVPLTEARNEVGLWAADERLDGAFIVAVAERVSAGCVVASAGLDEEPGQAFPVLMAIEGRASPPCPVGGTYSLAGPHDEGRALLGACAPGELQRDLDGRDLATLYWCPRLHTEPVPFPGLGLVEPEQLVEQQRLRPDPALSA